jgi:hypothetical protein
MGLKLGREAIKTRGLKIARKSLAELGHKAQRYLSNKRDSVVQSVAKLATSGGNM